MHKILTKNKEINKLQDYSQIYYDFHCKNLEKNVIILSSHQIISDDIVENELCATNILIPKIAAIGVPVATIEFPYIPITILLPSIQICNPIIEFKIIAKAIINFTKTVKDDGFINFGLIFNSNNFKAIECKNISKLLHLHFSVHNNEKFSARNAYQEEKIIYCKFHDCKYLVLSEFINYFILVK